MHIKAPSIKNNKDFELNPIYYCGEKNSLESSIKTILENKKSIQHQKDKWESYRYPEDKDLNWLDKLNRK